MKTGIRIFFTVFMLISLGCSGTVGQPGLRAPQSAQRTTNAADFELDEDLEAELRNVATDFTMQIPDSRYAWERAQLFFKEQTTQSHFSAGRADAVILTNSGSKDLVLYTLQKSSTDDGTRFTVRCGSGAKTIPPDVLTIQCKNLARFIHFGILEQSLIIR